MFLPMGGAKREGVRVGVGAGVGGGGGVRGRGGGRGRAKGGGAKGARLCVRGRGLAIAWPGASHFYNQHVTPNVHV